jgi:hypothetical protein
MQAATIPIGGSFEQRPAVDEGEGLNVDMKPAEEVTLTNLVT